MKLLYSYLRRMMKGSTNNKIPSLVEDIGNKFTDDQQKADALVCYFSSVFSDSSEHYQFSPEPFSVSSQINSAIFTSTQMSCWTNTYH